MWPAPYSGANLAMTSAQQDAWKACKAATVALDTATKKLAAAQAEFDKAATDQNKCLCDLVKSLSV